MTFRTRAGDAVTGVTADEMREVDRVAVEAVGLGLLQMMENAGRNLAAHALGLIERHDPDRVVVLAGGGGNGGGGICAARHLHDRGVPVRVVCDRDPADLEGGAATQAQILDQTPVVVEGPPDLHDLAGVLDGALALDAVIGYGLTEAPRGAARDVIAAVDGAEATLSLDVPSGVDATTGETPGLAVEPDRTLTLALPKTGLETAAVGDLWLGDLGIPPVVFERAGIDYAEPFDEEWWVELAVDTADDEDEA